MLDSAALKDLLGEKVTPVARREVARYLRQVYEMSERRACRVIGIDRTNVRAISACDRQMIPYASG
jgi:hypothetical protein